MTWLAGLLLGACLGVVLCDVLRALAAPPCRECARLGVQLISTRADLAQLARDYHALLQAHEDDVRLRRAWHASASDRTPMAVLRQHLDTACRERDHWRQQYDDAVRRAKATPPPRVVSPHDWKRIAKLIHPDHHQGPLQAEATAAMAWWNQQRSQSRQETPR